MISEKISRSSDALVNAMYIWFIIRFTTRTKFPLGKQFFGSPGMVFPKARSDQLG